VSLEFSKNLLATCRAVRRTRRVSTSSLRLSASSGWPEAADLNAVEHDRAPPRVLTLRTLERTPPAESYSGGRALIVLTLPITKLPIGTTRDHGSTGTLPTEAPRAPMGDHNLRRPASWRTQVGVSPSASNERVQFLSQSHLETRDSPREPFADAQRQARVSPAAPPIVGLTPSINKPVDSNRPLTHEQANSIAQRARMMDFFSDNLRWGARGAEDDQPPTHGGFKS